VTKTRLPLIAIRRLITFTRRPGEATMSLLNHFLFRGPRPVLDSLLQRRM